MGNKPWGPQITAPQFGETSFPRIPRAIKTEIEKLVCEKMEREFPKDVVSKDVCERLREHVPIVPQSACDAIANKLYDDAAAKCPAKLLTESIPPFAKNILEKFACSFLEKKFPEGVVAQEICEY